MELGNQLGTVDVYHQGGSCWIFSTEGDRHDSEIAITVLFRTDSCEAGNAIVSSRLAARIAVADANSLARPRLDVFQEEDFARLLYNWAGTSACRFDRQ